MTEHVCEWGIKETGNDDGLQAQSPPDVWIECVDCLNGLTFSEAERRLNAMERLSAEDLAISFHDYYEELAPSFGYKTRKDTRQFDINSPNGKLMIAVAERVIANILEAK